MDAHTSESRRVQRLCVHFAGNVQPWTQSSQGGNAAMDGLTGDSNEHVGVAKVDPRHHPPPLYLQQQTALASARPIMSTPLICALSNSNSSCLRATRQPQPDIASPKIFKPCRLTAHAQSEQSCLPLQDCQLICCGAPQSQEKRKCDGMCSWPWHVQLARWK